VARDDDVNHDERRSDPLPLEYFGASAPERLESRGVMTSTILLLASWIPYICGVINAGAVAQSYVPAVTAVHVHASIVLLGLGLLLSIASLMRFLRARQYPGAITAGAVVVVQALLAGCLGLA
jgi:hypothetical protein